MTREETSKYTDLLASGKARQFSFTMEAKSVITFPSGEMKLPGPGFYEVTGLAWSGRGRVARSKCRPTAARPGARRAKIVRCRFAPPASAFPGCGTVSRRCCRAAAPMRPVTFSPRSSNWSTSAGSPDRSGRSITSMPSRAGQSRRDGSVTNVHA